MRKSNLRSQDATPTSRQMKSDHVKWNKGDVLFFMGLVHATLALPWPCISVLGVVLVLAANVGGQVVPC